MKFWLNNHKDIPRYIISISSFKEMKSSILISKNYRGTGDVDFKSNSFVSIL